MYYNIKITSNGSEFHLNSNDREITQNEMDRYFAEILDVSDEFKSKLKKIEVRYKNVKSIKEIEEQETEKEEKTQEENTLTSIRNINNNSNPEIVDINENKKVNQEPELSQEDIHEMIERRAQELAQAKLNEAARRKMQQSIEQVIKAKPKETIQTTSKEDVEELISLAKDKFSSYNNTQTEKEIYTDEVEIPDRKDMESEQDKKDKDELTQEILDGIFNFNPDSLEEDYIIEKQDTHNQNIATPTKEEIVPPMISLEEIEISLQDEVMPTTPEVPKELPPQIKEYIETKITIPEINLAPQTQPSLIEQTEEKTEVVEQEKPSQTKSTIQIDTLEKLQAKMDSLNSLDFKPFLAGFASKDIYDEFIICAFFIKNVLKQESFTMKFVNSKLFQASGKIANLAIADELIAKEYIKAIETDEGKKYCITASGESYFAQTLQG